MKLLMKVALAILALFAMQAVAYAQHPMTNLDAVWKKTYGRGLIRSIKPTMHGTYIAAGQTWISSDAPGNKKEALLIEIDESGNVIREIKQKPVKYVGGNQVVDNRAPAEVTAHFRFGFKTPDGGYLAFGQITDNTAKPWKCEFAGDRKGNWYQFPNNTIDRCTRGPELSDGIWIVKFSASGQMQREELVRGRYPSDGWQVGNQFIISGCDKNAISWPVNGDATAGVVDNDADRNNTMRKGETLLRRYTYNTSTNFIDINLNNNEDKYEAFKNVFNTTSAMYRSIKELFKVSDTEFIAVTRDYMFIINTSIFNNSGLSGFNTNSIELMLDNLRAASTTPAAVQADIKGRNNAMKSEPGGYSVSPGHSAGHYFIGTRLREEYLEYPQYGTAMFKVKSPSLTTPLLLSNLYQTGFTEYAYYAPYRLPVPYNATNTNKYYFGAKRVLAKKGGFYTSGGVWQNNSSGGALLGGGDFDDKNDTYKMYGLIEDASGNTLPTVYSGADFPYGTSPKMAGLKDGFFATGSTVSSSHDGQGAGFASIAKLSTCSRFQLNPPSGDPNISLGGTTVTVSPRTYTYVNTPGITNTAVSAYYTVTDITPGGSNISGLPTSTVSLATSTNSFTVPARTYQLNGSDFAILRYTVFAVNANNCQQTHDFMVFITGLTLQKYYACPGARVVMKLGPTAGVEYSWYKTAPGNEIPQPSGGGVKQNTNPFDSLVVWKNEQVSAASLQQHHVTTTGNPADPGFPVADDIGSWYVEPYVKAYNWRFPRIKVDLIGPGSNNLNCGGTINSPCMTQGTLLFKDDFGGNNSTDPDVSPGTPARQSELSYQYEPNVSGHGKYALVKELPVPSGHQWERHRDHTNPGQKLGYFLAADATNDAGQFFRKRIDNLQCSGMELYFTAWIINLCKANASPVHDRPMLQFVIEDTNNNVLAKYYTGPIEPEANLNPSTNYGWKQYGFSIPVPSGHTSLVLKIINAGEGITAQGNDFGLDDIEIRLCGLPKVEIGDFGTRTDTTICKNSSFKLEGFFDNSVNSFAGPLNAQWYKQDANGDPRNNSMWNPVGNPISFNSPSSTAGKYSLPYPSPNGMVSDPGFYLLIVTTSTPNAQSNCCARKYVEIRNKDCASLNRDTATVQKYRAVEIDLLKNDVLPPGFSPGAFSLKDSVLKTGDLPKAGDLSVTGSGQNSKLIYINNGKPLSQQIDSFRYQIDFGNMPTSAWVYIYVLEDKNRAADCYGKTHKVELVHQSGVNFNWYQGAALAGNPTDNITLPAMTNSVTYQIEPLNTHRGNFPKGDFTVAMANSGTNNVAKMRWTGQIDSVWNNPLNWVEVHESNNVVSESPALYAPTRCVNVTIPSVVDNFPVLESDSAYCAAILMKDRAMLKNPHLLSYDSAAVEIKLKPAERDRFLMWSAPLTGVYSGDYFYRKSGLIQRGDVYMNFFQQSNPGPLPSGGAGAIASNMLTATFGSLNQSLELGRAFNLKVVSTTYSKDSLLCFPQWGQYPNSPITRQKGSKFITNGLVRNSSGTYNLPVVSGQGLTPSGVTMMQVVNPYMAYLDFDKFYAANSNVINSGFYTWSGDPKDGFTALALTDGNRYVAASGTAGFNRSTDKFIPPLQSFFVSCRSGYSNLVISPAFTTVKPADSYKLRSAVTKGGILNIKVTQGDRQAYAALLYSPGATAGVDREDMPLLVFNETNLAVYTFSASNTALAINSDGQFNMNPLKMGVLAASAGEVTLSFANQETFGHDVVLVDHQLNKRIDISITPTYTFVAAKAGEINNRFTLELHYTGRGVGIEGAHHKMKLQSVITVGSTDAGILIRANAAELIQSVEIRNMLGQLVYKDDRMNVTERLVSLPNRRLYIVKVKIGDEIFIEKVMLK
ncbi:MAG: T9SS type A sorting domain-containing protein [Tannerellaceae bacterium]|jgi:hypothetical protein|nr:T9SS type A sorting domain-containing protein [Tannerellaceae bacterium]